MTIPVAAAIIFLEGKILIAKRAPHKHLAGLWEFPGGKIESHETPEMCIRRELKEELNIQVTIKDYLADNEYDFGTFKIQLKAYICLYKAGNPALTDHDEIRWVNIDQLSSFDLAPADIPLVQKLVNYAAKHKQLMPPIQAGL